MKSLLRNIALVVLALSSVVLTLPANAVNIGTLYSNGPASPTDNFAWAINFGHTVSNSFTLSGASTVTGFSFGVWVFPGDVPLTIDWSITSAEFGGTTFGSGTASVSASFLWTNGTNPALCGGGSCDVDEVTVATSNVNLASGVYWLNLDNAVTAQGNPMMWEQNNGVGCSPTDPPTWCTSLASENTVGAIGSEDPDIYGYTNSSEAPEPGSLTLLGSGVLTLASLLRRRLRA